MAGLLCNILFGTIWKELCCDENAEMYVNGDEPV